LTYSSGVFLNYVHGVATHNIELFVTVTKRTSNPASVFFHFITGITDDNDNHGQIRQLGDAGIFKSHQKQHFLCSGISGAYSDIAS
jgi:hypothetical protein